VFRLIHLYPFVKDYSLTPFLYERSYEVLGIRLENIVNFVQYRVHILGQFLVALGDVAGDLRSLFDLVLVLPLRAGLAAVVGGHGNPLSILMSTLARRTDTFPLPARTAIVRAVSFPTSISLVTLGVGDVAAATAFYERLGFTRSAASVDGEVSFFGTPGGAILAVWSADELAADAQQQPPRGPAGFRGVALALNVASREAVDGALRLAEQAGATIPKPAVATDWGGYSGYFADPDGHLWEVAHNPGWPLDDRGLPQLPD
jgi:predicted lactoylglutathione lyase